MKIFMLPYAGCIGRPYKDWADKYGEDMILLNYFENKNKMNSCNNINWNQLIVKIYNDIKNNINNREEYAIYGHSMGAAVAYDLYQKIVNENFIKPKKIIFSGSLSPQNIKNRDETITEEDFKKKYIELGGIDKILLNNAEFMDVFFEMLHRDLKLFEGYSYNEINSKFDCDVYVLNGVDDEKSSFKSWKQLCNKKCEYMIFHGKHFFVFDNVEVFGFIKLIVS